ncbi:O-antigen ligase family protein [Acidobacteriia bacterium AH_259_A11_L15]|nr:O-antigen ligase family protein [Acidobacteriia bacterium AH_259_A11_L15]
MKPQHYFILAGTLFALAVALAILVGGNVLLVLLCTLLVFVSTLIAVAKPVNGLLVFFAIAYFPLYPSVRIYGIDFMAIVGMALSYPVLLATAFSLLLRREGLLRRKTPVDLPLLLLFAWFVVSAIIGGIYRNEARLLWADFLQATIFPLAFFIGTCVFQRQDRIKPFLRKFFALSVVFALIRLGQWMMGIVPGAVFTSVGELVELSGGNVSRLAWLLFPIVLAFYLYRQRNTHTKLLYLALILFFFLILISWARTLWIGIFASLLFILILSGSRKKIFSFARFAVGLAVLALISSLFLSLLAGTPWEWKRTFLGASSDRLRMGLRAFHQALGQSPGAAMTATVRLDETEAIFKQAMGNPLQGIFGFGMGSKYVSFKWAADNARVIYGEKHFVHNKYAELLLRTGFIGLAVFVWWSASFFWHGIRSFRRMEHGPLKGLGLGILASFFCVSVAALAGVGLIKHPVGALLGAATGLLFTLPVRQGGPLGSAAKETNPAARGKAG